MPSGVLIAQRPPGRTLAKPREFPGGKIEPCERPKDPDPANCTRKSASLQEDCLAPLTFASYAYENFHLLMPLYICRRWDGVASAKASNWPGSAPTNCATLRDAGGIPLIPHLIDLLM